MIGRVHPTFMGGEYRPDTEQDEVEIARISPRSTTADVISERARKTRTETPIASSTRA